MLGGAAWKDRSATARARTGPAPVPIWDGNPFRDISGGNTHGCGLAIDNAAYGWGFNGAGQLGDGTKEDRLTPTAVLGSAAP